MANLFRPSRPSISRPKYQKMAIVITVQSVGSLASGHVNRRQISPRVRVRVSTQVSTSVRLIAQTNIAGHGQPGRRASWW